jgi:hypothetical protein
LSHSGADFDDYEKEDCAYRRTLEQADRQLDIGLNVQYVDRRFVPNFLFSEKDLVVVIGQDGLVANVAKYATGQPIIGINPDPSRFDGVLVPTQVKLLRAALDSLLAGKATLCPVTLAEVKLNDTQRLLAFNDFFIGCQSHVSARYHLLFEKRNEEQSSSGIIVSTGAGSTGWLSSVFNMASGLNELSGGKKLPPLKIGWNSPDLYFIVREPFVSKHSQAGIVGGFLHENECLVIESRMPSGGTIFSDGIESDFLQFNSGSIATIRKAQERALIYLPGSNSQGRAGLRAETAVHVKELARCK